MTEVRCGYDFQQAHRYNPATDNIPMTPTRFPKPPTLPFNGDMDDTGAQVSFDDDFTDHMTALYMAGSLEYQFARQALGEAPSSQAHSVVAGCLQNIAFGYRRAVKDGHGVYNGLDLDMSGAFTYWAGGGHAYGFYTGEVLRALGLYLLWSAKAG